MNIRTILCALSLIGTGLATYPTLPLPPGPPKLRAFPHSPGNFKYPDSGSRLKRVCTIPSNLKDAAPAILSAARSCNNGGTVYFPAGQTFTIASPLDLTFLHNIDFAILGTISFSDEIGIWVNKTFNYPFQSVSLIWRFGGENVRIYGHGVGTLDGHGQTYWDQLAVDKQVFRPIIFGTDGLKRSSISGLNYLNPPNWFNFIGNSSDVLIDGLNLNVISADPKAPAKNSDGWDTYRSHNIVIQNSWINNTDDCVSFKPNSTSIIVQNLKCGGSCHGLSVGSLGQYPGEVDIVRDVYVYNARMSNCGDIGKIKVWPGAPTPNNGAEGGGSGLVKNITWDTMYSDSNNEVILVTGCYGTKNKTYCAENPSKMRIEDITFKNFKGVTKDAKSAMAGEITCSSPDACSNIQAYNIDVDVPSGQTPTYTCMNVDRSLLDLNCVEPKK